MMSANNEEPSAVNGRLRPRKPSIALPSARSKSLRRLSKLERKLEKSVIKPEPPSSLEFLCPYCDKKFASKKSVSKHVGSSHGQESGVFACQFCSDVEGGPLEALRHMLDAHPDHYFACFDCRTRFASSNELKAHKINLCRKLKPLGKSYRNSLCQSKEKNETKKILSNKDSGQQGLEEKSGFKGIVIACELKPTQADDPADIESNITTNLILPTNKGIVNSGSLSGKGPVLVIDDVQWNKRMAGNLSFHNSEADQILSRLGVVHRSPGAAFLPRSHTYKYIEENTKFEKCFDTVFYSKVASNVQENLEKFLDGSFNRTPLDPDSIIKTRKSKNLINTAEGFPILLSSEQFSRTVFGAYLPRAIAPRHKWKRDSIENEKHIISADQLLRDSHANNCIVTLVSSLDIWTQLCMRRKFENKFNNASFNERKTEKQHVISNELKEILESRELPPRALSDEKFAKVVPRQVREGVGEFPWSLGLRATTSQPQPLPPPALLSGEWARPRCFVCCACGEHTRDPKALVTHFNAHHPTAHVSHYDIAGELLCNDDSILKHLYVPSNQTPNRTRPLRGIRECTKCSKSISIEELHQHMLECAGDTPVVKRKCRYRPFGVRRRRARMPDNAIRKKIRRNMCQRKTRQKNKIRSRSRMRSEVGDAETIRKMIADLPAKRHRASEGTVAGAQHWSRKRDITLNKLLRNRQTIDNGKSTEKQPTLKDPKNSLKRDPKVKKKENGNTSKKIQSHSLASRPARVASRILRKGELKRKNALRRSPRSANQAITETPNDKQNPSKGTVCISSGVQTDELSLQASSDRVDVNGSRGRSSEQAAQSSGGRGQAASGRSGGAGDHRAGASNTNNANRPQDTSSQIKHSIARLTATTVTHDKAVQFQPHFLVNQECSKSSTSKPYLLSEPQVFYENDIMAARLDKPPLVNYNQTSPVDPYMFQKSKLNKPRKKLTDCIAMLKNKLVEPLPPQPPPMHSYSMHEAAFEEPAVMPMCYAPLEMMTPLNMIPDCHYDVPTSIPYAHTNTNTDALSMISAPLDLSGKRSTSDVLISTEYETLDLSQKNYGNSHGHYPYHMSDEDVVVDLCTKSVHRPIHEETLDLSRRSNRFDESPIARFKRPCETRSIEHPPIYDYDFNASYYNNNSMIHQSTELLHHQHAFDYSLENRSIMQPIPSTYPRDLAYERIQEINVPVNNPSPLKVDKSSTTPPKTDHINKKVGAFNTSVQSTAPVDPVQTKGKIVDATVVVAATTLEKDNKKNKLERDSVVDESAKKIALLPKEIVEILGKMPTDQRNQLLDVLPQYLGCNASVKQLKLVVDIHPEALMSPMGITALKSASTEIATQTLASSTDATPKSNSVKSKVIDLEKSSNDSSKKETQTKALLTENIRVNVQAPPIPSAVVSPRDPIPLQNVGLIKDLSTAQTVEKPKDIKEKTASSLRAVRIKTSSQRRHTQNASLEIKPTEHVPIVTQPILPQPCLPQPCLSQPCLPQPILPQPCLPQPCLPATTKASVVIQQAEVTSTQHNAKSVDKMQRNPSHEIANLPRTPLQESNLKNNLETDKNKPATLPANANISTCIENAPLLDKNESNKQDAIDKDTLPEILNKNIEGRSAVSDGDSEDDVSLAVIVKQKLAERKIPLNAKAKSDSPSRQRKKRKPKPSNDGNCHIEIDLENKNTSISVGTDVIPKETVTCIQEPDVSKISAASEPESVYLGKKLRTRTMRSFKKEEQPNNLQQIPLQNDTETHSNKENSDLIQANIDKHLSSENIAVDNLPRDNIIEKKDGGQPLVIATQVSCQTLQDIEIIKPIDQISYADSKSKRKIKEKNAGKPKTVPFQSNINECIVMQAKEPINTDLVHVNRQDNLSMNESKEMHEIKTLYNKTSNDVENSTGNCNKPKDNDQTILSSEKSDASVTITDSCKEAPSPRNLRRSRRGKLEIDELLVSSQNSRDSPLLLPVATDQGFEDNDKSCSKSYVETIDTVLPSKKPLKEKELKSELINKKIIDEVETKCEQNINSSKKSKPLRKKKSDIVDEPPIFTSPTVETRPEIKETAFISKSTDINISLSISMAEQNIEKHSAEAKQGPTATSAPIISEVNLEKRDDSTITKGKDEVIEKTKSVKRKKKSKSVGERKTKNQLSTFDKPTKNIVESSEDYPELSENPNLLVVSETSLSMSPIETKKSTACYNVPRASAVTRSKSSLSKSEDGNSVGYDPYDIDQEDNLLDKISPLKKATPIVKSFPDESFPTKIQSTETSKLLSHIETNKHLSHVETTRTSLSDSDDSSKSDVPLKKLVDEKLERQNNKNHLLKSVKSQTDEPVITTVADAPRSTLSEDESLRSEQFMESFGFFSERRPRKSNIIAAKKISETFQNDLNLDGNEILSTKIDRKIFVPTTITADFPIKCSVYCTAKQKKGRKRKLSKDVTFPYCTICEKAFRRTDNYWRHVMSYYHMTRVLKQEMNCDIELDPIPDQPNCLIIYRQHLERIKRLTEKIKRKNKKLGITASPPKFELPSIEEIMAEAKLHTYSGPAAERRGLSRDEALFIDCCELLKESHKNEPVETVTFDTQVSQQREDNPVSKIIAEDRTDSKSDGDVDSITAKTILESEEVRNLENDLLCGLKEAAAQRQLEFNNQMQSPNSQSLDNFDLDLDAEPAGLDHSSVAEGMLHAVSEPVSKLSNPKPIDSYPEEHKVVEKKLKKTRKKETTEIPVDIYEDKFDKIKRKCRSQAAAAKVTTALAETNTSSKTKKKNDTKKIKKMPKTVKHNAIPTKGALKGFECIKSSESVDNASSSEPGYEPTPPSKRKKSSRNHKKERRELFKRSSEPHCSNVLPRTRADIYEFMDNDDGDAVHFRGSSSKDKFKTFKDIPSTSKADPIQQAYESSSSASDGDDFVYMSDDYLCSADETENSLLSSELSSTCKITEIKKSSKRKEAIEKNTVMGKIFKNNAVRNERKPSSSSKETTNPSKANLDQLFDSLLEDEPNSSMLKDDADLPSSKRASLSVVVAPDVSAATTGSQSCNDSILNTPPREKPMKRKKNRENKKVKRKRSKMDSDDALEGSSYNKDKVKRRLSREGEVLLASSYGVAAHRARRACAVGKQNVLAESWSSESELDAPRAAVADTSIKKRNKKNKHSASRHSRHVSFGKYEKDSQERHRAVALDEGGEPAADLRGKRNGREDRVRSRPQITYSYSSDEGEEAHPQQHGWIVGNSHKKLVTMLAHAKGRKRDDKRSYID